MKTKMSQQGLPCWDLRFSNKCHSWIAKLSHPAFRDIHPLCVNSWSNL